MTDAPQEEPRDLYPKKHRNGANTTCEGEEDCWKIRNVRKKALRLSIVQAKLDQWGKKSMRETASIANKGVDKVNRFTRRASAALFKS